MMEEKTCWGWRYELAWARRTLTPGTPSGGQRNDPDGAEGGVNRGLNRLWAVFAFAHRRGRLGFAFYRPGSVWIVVAGVGWMQRRNPKPASLRSPRARGGLAGAIGSWRTGFRSPLSRSLSSRYDRRLQHPHYLQLSATPVSILESGRVCFKPHICFEPGRLKRESPGLAAWLGCPDRVWRS
jgi:hypothetical protein